MKRVVATLAVLSVLISAGLLFVQWQAGRFSASPIAVTEPVLFEIRPGSSFRTLVAQLKARGILQDSLWFQLYARKQKLTGAIKAGEYRLTPGMSHAELLQRFVEGKVVQRSVTFVEGLRLQDYLTMLQQQDGLIFDLPEASVSAVADTIGFTGDNPEGWIYPDTYHYTRDTAVSQLLVRAYERMQRELEDAWSKRAEGLPLASPTEALILASIVEKETGAVEEREQIAGVFIRRLHKGMRLQTDPTVIYGLGDRYEGNLTRAHLRQATAYNTYRINGLPPTPIASPGRAAIDAVLHPAEGETLYFVAKGDGRHVFSKTLAAHRQAVDRYQRYGRRDDYRSVPKEN